MKPDTELYKYHTKNLRAVSSALDRVALSARNAIARTAETEVETYTRLYLTLLGAWAECRLAKLLYHSSAYAVADRQSVRAQNTHLGRWHKVVELAFRKYYKIPKADLNEHTLVHSANSRFQTLKSLLDSEL